MNTNKPARLPALPPTNTSDASMRAWMQAVTERLEVREGQRGDAAERVVTRRDLDAARLGTPTASPDEGWWTKYRDIDALAEALRETEMHDDLLRRIARAGGATDDEGTGRTGPTTTVSQATPPSELRLTRNDLDFYRLPGVSSAHPAVYQELVCTVDTREFFRNGGDHIIFAFDCTGAQGNGRPHIAPMVRNGANLFERGRGFLVTSTSAVVAEHWTGTFSPELAPVSSTITGFNVNTTPIFTVRVTGGYRVGALAEYMSINIHRNGATGPIVFSGSVPWGWGHSGAHVAYVGAIGQDCRSPNDTGGVERFGPGLASNAVMPFSGAKLSVY